MKVGKVSVWVYQINVVDKHHVNLGLFLNGKMIEYHKCVNKAFADNIIKQKQKLGERS